MGQEGGRLMFRPPTGSLRIGVDLVTVDEVVDSLRAYGDRYLARVYTEREVAHCRRPTGEPDAARLAGRFATKEAATKALRLTEGSYRNIEVTSDADGAPSLLFHGTAAHAAMEAGVRDCAVSITHDRGLAMATVVLVGSTGPDEPDRRVQEGR